MADSLSPIVSVTITRDTATVTRVGFGTILILTYDVPNTFTDAWREYTSQAEMAADDFDSTHYAYRAAGKIFGGELTPEKVVVAKMTSVSPVTKLTMTSATEGDVVKATLRDPATGTAYDLSYTVLAAATTSTVATAFELLTEAVAGVNSTASGAVVSCTSAAGSRKVHIYGLQNCTLEEDNAAAAGYEDVLNDLLEDEDLEFFHLLIDTANADDTEAASAWCETNKKLFWLQASGSAALAGTDTTIENAIALSRDFTVPVRPKNSWDTDEAAAVGFVAARDPGTYTTRKKMKGMTSLGPTSTQKTVLKNHYTNYAQKYRNSTIFQEGKTTSGEWIDIIIGIEAVKARVQEDQFDMVLAAEKLPITDPGLSAIKGTMEASLENFVGTKDAPGLFVDGSIVTSVPKYSDISDADLQARTVNGVKFYAKFEQAAHYVGIEGKVSN